LIDARERPETPMQRAFYAVIGAVIGAVRVNLNASEVTISGRRPYKIDTFMVEWPSEDSTYAATLMKHFLLASAAASPRFFFHNTLSQLFDELVKSARPQVERVLLASTEVRALLEWPYATPFPEPILILEDSYNSRVSRLQADRYHWAQLEPKGAIIDWPLLCLWIAILGYDDFGLPEPLPSGDPARFIRWLGKELVRSTNREDRFQRP
jgi:hypothetical protein